MPTTNEERNSCLLFLLFFRQIFTSNHIYGMNSNSVLLEWIRKINNKNEVCNRKCRHVNNKCFPVEFKDQRTNGPVNAHLIICPSKAQNIQNLENIW